MEKLIEVKEETKYDKSDIFFTAFIFLMIGLIIGTVIGHVI